MNIAIFIMGTLMLFLLAGAFPLDDATPS